METKTAADHSLMDLYNKIRIAAIILPDPNIDPHFKAVCKYLQARSRLANRIIRSEDTEEIRVLTNIYLSHNESIKEILGL